ncbi:hypothetical protein CEQ90_04840 [Lewinellaceae bacterium SD302]|nr:hypothetical protein CEQ90_04840 [Lewinellaceae bacterium SD302]
MKYLFYLFFSFVSLSSIGLIAQADIGATIVDSSGVSLPGANAILLRASDSLLISFGTADNKGDFLMENVPVGSYLLQISFLGFERPDQTVEVTASDQYLGLGELRMYPAGFLLSGVEVTADRIPIRMKGDTMMYDADAFAVGDNAVVEDLLRRLPGMSIDANGSITWRGQAVQQVMINGKPFFAGNSTLITQNLDAKAIKNVEVFDQKSNQEELSGIDDGEDNTTVNLEMKEDFKAKLFGELYGGYGSDNRYDGGGKIFRISDASQLGALGTINNVNRVGFTGDELSSYNQNIGQGGGWWRRNSGGRGQLPVYGSDQIPGQNRSIAAGLNYGTSVGKGQLQLGYSLFDRELTQTQTVREAFNQDQNIREINSQQVDGSDSYMHRFTLNYQADIDSTSRLNMNAAFSLEGSDENSLSAVSVRDDSNGNQDYTVDQASDQYSPNGDFGIDYSRRLGKPGRTMNLEAYGDFGRTENDQSIFTVGLEDDLNLTGALVNGLQTQDRLTISDRVGASVQYEEPLSNKLRWETEVSYVQDRSEGDFQFELEEDRVSNLLVRKWNTLRAESGLNYRFGRRNSLSVTGNYYGNVLDLSGDVDSKSNYNYFLPAMRLRVRSKKGFYRLSLGASPDAPSITQLQTIAEPGQSGRVTVGNPDLEPAVNYRFSGSYWFNDQFRAISANANMSVSYNDNDFGNALTFTSGQQIYQTINVSHSWSSNVYLGTTVGFDAINGEVRLFGRAGGSRGQGFVDGVSRLNTTTNLSSGVNLTTELNEKSFLTAGYTYGQNRNAFDDEDAEVITTVTHDLLGQFEIEFSPKWRFESRFLYRIFEEAAFAGAASIPDLRLSLEVRPFRKAGHYLRFGVFDVFNQNTVINRQAQAFVTTETESDGLGRYFLGTFHFRIK